MQVILFIADEASYIIYLDLPLRVSLLEIRDGSQNVLIVGKFKELGNSSSTNRLHKSHFRTIESFFNYLIVWRVNVLLPFSLSSFLSQEVYLIYLIS